MSKKGNTASAAFDMEQIEAVKREGDSVLVHPLLILKARVLLAQAGDIPLSIEAQLMVIKLEQIAPFVNLLYASSNPQKGDAAKDFATNNIFSEAMICYIANQQGFFEGVLEPLQSLSPNNLMEQVFPHRSKSNPDVPDDTITLVGDDENDVEQ